MILPSYFPNQPNARLIGISCHQQVWKIGWTKVPSANGRSREGFKTTNSGSTCNYVRTLHDGRIMEHWAYPAETNDIPAIKWPDEFWYVLTADITNKYVAKREEFILRKELVQQLLSVIKYGQQQHQTAVDLIYSILQDRLTRPEKGLELLFQTWNNTLT